MLINSNNALCIVFAIPRTLIEIKDKIIRKERSSI
jgi:hypothetical protein